MTHARLTVWLVVLLEYLLVAGCVSGFFFEVASAPRGRCVDSCSGDGLAMALTAVFAGCVLLTGLLAAPLVDAAMRRGRRLRDLPDPADLRGLARTGTRTAVYGFLWGVVGAPIVACLVVGMIKALV